MKNIADVIKRIDEELTKQGLNQKQLAEKIGVGEDWISRRMTMKSKLTVAGLISIANALNIKPSSLLEDAEDIDKRDDFKDYCKAVVREILEEEIVSKINDK